MSYVTFADSPNTHVWRDSTLTHSEDATRGCYRRVNSLPTCHPCVTESSHTYEWVMSHGWTSHVTLNDTHFTCVTWLIFDNLWMSHVAFHHSPDPCDMTHLWHTVNAQREDALEVPAVFSRLRFWRSTPVAALPLPVAGVAVCVAEWGVVCVAACFRRSCCVWRSLWMTIWGGYD